MIIFKIIVVTILLVLVIISALIAYNIRGMQDIFISRLMKENLEYLFRYKAPTNCFHFYMILLILTLLSW